jgi:hypothetical protein
LRHTNGRLSFVDASFFYDQCIARQAIQRWVISIVTKNHFKPILLKNHLLTGVAARSFTEKVIATLDVGLSTDKLTVQVTAGNT